MQNRQFKFEIKSISDQGTFSGMASVFGNVDSGGDVVEYGAFSRTLKHRGGEVPILWQHDQKQPIGLGKLQEGPRGLEINGELVLESSRAKEAYALMRKGVLKGLSIGFDIVKDSIANGVRHLHELKLYEVSVVTFPMNELATVSNVKSTDPAVQVRLFREMLAVCAESFSR